MIVELTIDMKISGNNTYDRYDWHMSGIVPFFLAQTKPIDYPYRYLPSYSLGTSISKISIYCRTTTISHELEIPFTTQPVF